MFVQISRFELYTNYQVIELQFLGKWLRYYPNTLSYYQNRESVGIDLEDSLFCRQCLPNCEEVTYEIYTYYHDYRSEDPKF